MNANHQLVNQDSGNTEWWTPKPIVAVAAKLMGGIDLDPACSMEAFMYHDDIWYYYHKNGLEMPWFGKVWMNHPFGRSENACKENCKKKTCKTRGYHISEDAPGNKDWINKLVDGYESGKIEQACCICFAAMNAEWMTPLKEYVQFFFNGRVAYIDPETLQPQKSVTKDSVFTWLYDRDQYYYDTARQALQGAFDFSGIDGVAK